MEHIETTSSSRILLKLVIADKNNIIYFSSVVVLSLTAVSLRWEKA